MSVSRQYNMRYIIHRIRSMNRESRTSIGRIQGMEEYSKNSLFEWFSPFYGHNSYHYQYISYGHSQWEMHSLRVLCSCTGSFNRWASISWVLGIYLSPLLRIFKYQSRNPGVNPCIVDPMPLYSGWHTTYLPSLQTRITSLIRILLFRSSYSSY